MTDLSVTPTALDVFHLEARLTTPRQNAFGTMFARPALLVRLTDASGIQGWGEVFCNWPAFGARHRKRVLEEILAPKFLNRTFSSPTSLWDDMTQSTHALVIQSNEPGPFEQCIAALDIAAWDLAARRNDRPLYDLIGSGKETAVPVYASALTDKTVGSLVSPLIDDGWVGFKIKVGFGAETDQTNVENLRTLIGDNGLMMDANQGWTVGDAASQINALAAFNPLWIEEPVAADVPNPDWSDLAQEIQTPLAAGENLRGVTQFRQAAKLGGVRYLQPDAIKWGGISGLIKVAKVACEENVEFAPHYLGSGIGLLATAHAAKALGAAWMEIDVTENPLRTGLLGNNTLVDGGFLSLNACPGIGAAPSHGKISEFQHS